MPKIPENQPPEPVHQDAIPFVSIVVIIYNMAEQAQKTLRSLVSGYQIGVCKDDYEVIIVENESSQCLENSFLKQLPDNFRYFLRKNAESSPAKAINFGALQAHGEHICIMIDGARMLTPGVVKQLIRGHIVSPHAVVTVPGYHLGEVLQQTAVLNGYCEQSENDLLNSISWPDDGYKLFDIACLSGSCKPGFFRPNCESNCISLSRAMWADLGGFDERFDLTGGGLINLDFYKRACEHPDILHVIALGEGTFHQFHGGITTGGQPEHKRQEYIDASKLQYRQLRGSNFQNPVTTPVYLGELPVNVMRFVRHSADVVMRRESRLAAMSTMATTD